MPQDITVDLINIPPSIPKDVVYFANARSIFFTNEGAFSEIGKRISSLNSYGGRLIPIVPFLWSGKCTLFLARRPAESILEYFKTELGMNVPEIFVFDEVDGRSEEMEMLLKELAPCDIAGMMISEDLEGMAEASGNTVITSYEACALANNKHALHHKLVEVGLPVFESYDATNQAEVCSAAAKLKAQGYDMAVAKSAVGASGIGLVKFNTDAPEEIPDFMFKSAPCLIQGWLDTNIERIEEVISPSVQFCITDERVSLYDITDQILSEDSVHEGNLAPPQSFANEEIDAEMLRQASIITRWLSDEGYRGLGSVDYHLAMTSNGGFEVRVCEVNGRLTGATYPSYLARRYRPGGVWVMQNIKYNADQRCREILQDFRDADILFKIGDDRGILPINFNLTDINLVNKGQFMALGPDYETAKSLCDQAISLAQRI